MLNLRRDTSVRFEVASLPTVTAGGLPDG